VFLCLGGIIRSRELFEEFKIFKQDERITNVNTYDAGYMAYEKFVNAFERFYQNHQRKIIVISNDSEFNEVHAFLLMMFSKLRRLGVTNFNKDRIASGDLSELGIDLIIMWEEDGIPYTEEWEI